jgi:hypothetical protein
LGDEAEVVLEEFTTFKWFKTFKPFLLLDSSPARRREGAGEV